MIVSRLPERGKIFEEDIVSDKSERFMLAEIMREKILLKFDKEIPHGVAVVINEFREREDGGIVDVSLDIVCRKAESQGDSDRKTGKGAERGLLLRARRDGEVFGEKGISHHIRQGGGALAGFGQNDRRAGL